MHRQPSEGELSIEGRSGKIHLTNGGAVKYVVLEKKEKLYFHKKIIHENLEAKGTASPANRKVELL